MHKSVIRRYQKSYYNTLHCQYALIFLFHHGIITKSIGHPVHCITSYGELCIGCPRLCPIMETRAFLEEAFISILEQTFQKNENIKKYVFFISMFALTYL